MDEGNFGYDQPMPSEVHATQYQPMGTSELLNHLNISPEFRELVGDLRGQTWDEMEQKFVEDPSKRKLMNDLGVQAIIRLLRPFFSRSATINDFDEKKIGKLMVYLRKHIKTIILSPTQLRRYDINTFDIDEIQFLISTYAYMNINRSLDANELIAITKVVRTVEQVRQTDSGMGGMRYGGFMGKIPRIFGAKK